MAGKKKQKKKLRKMLENILTGAGSGILTWLGIEILKRLLKLLS